MSISRSDRSERATRTPGDARLRKSQQAIFAAFFQLVQERDYESLRVADIVARAKVGRSTFYEHFADKDDVLARSISGPFSILADAIWQQQTPLRLEALLDHFWARRALSRTLFTGSLSRRLAAVLTGEIEARLRGGGRGAERLIVPVRLAAVQLAGTLLTPIVAWLAGESRCSVTQLAVLLHRVGAATLLAMTTAAPSGGSPAPTSSGAPAS